MNPSKIPNYPEVGYNFFILKIFFIFVIMEKENKQWYKFHYYNVVEPIWTKFHNYGLSYGQISWIFKLWSEPHRFYHGLNHLSEILDLMKKNGYWTPNDGYDKIMLYTAIFHDIIYDPTRDDNEEKSVEEFEKYVKLVNLHEKALSGEEIRIIKDNIMDTKTGNSNFTINYSEQFIKLDRYNLLYGDFKTILSKTMLLFKEQQFMDFKDWKIKTISFLSQFIDTNPNIKNVISYLEMWTPKIGIYAGSFNKFHKGHYNILQKSERIFDKIIIARGTNPEKKNELHPLPEILKYHQVINYNGLLTDLMNNLEYDVILIRGLRNSTDLQYEMTQFQYLQDLKPDIKIINIFCDKQFEHISSSAIRSLETFGKGSNYLL